MLSVRHTLAAAAVLLLLSAGLGCGSEPAEDAPRTEAQSVVADGLVYRAPMFRQLNPRVAPDRALVARSQLDRAGAEDDELLFGAFVEVCNESGRQQRVPEGFEVVDAFGQTYRPEEGIVAEPFDLETGTMLEPDECLPEQGGVADQAVPGAVLAFTLPRRALSDRPLFLVVPSDVADTPPARIQLDL